MKLYQNLLTSIYKFIFSSILYMSNIQEYSDQLELTFVATEDNEIAASDFENIQFRENLANKKITVDYGYFANGNLPLFIPDMLTELYTFTPTPVTQTNNTLSINSLDYVLRVRDTGTGDTYIYYILWTPELPVSAPSSRPSNQQAMYSNRYYWSKTPTHFSQIVTNAINALASSVAAISLGNVVQIVVGSSSFGLIINQNFVSNGFELELSHNLNKLFKFQSVYVDDMFEKVIFSTNTVAYNTQTCVVSNGIGYANWSPFDQIIISSDLNLKKIQKQNNLRSTTQFYNTQYQNVILEFSLTDSTPVDFYPYFEYITQSSNTKYIFFENDVDLKETFRISVLLYNVSKNVLFPYTMNKNEFINLKLRIFTQK